MKYSFGNIELSVNDEIMIKSEFEKRATKPSEGNAFFLEKAMSAYKNYDFSELQAFDPLEIDKVREKFAQDPELSTRPLIFVMYIFHRNGFLKDDYLTDPQRTYDLTDRSFVRTSRVNVPEGLIMKNGKFYGIGKDGHIWLYNFLNLCGIDTTDCIRYGQFTDSETKIRHQYFSKLKEFAEDKRHMYVTNEQATAINNLRRKYSTNIHLQDFLLNCTADFGFRESDSLVALKYNFKTFADLFPEEHMDRSEVLEIRRRQNTTLNG